MPDFSRTSTPEKTYSSASPEVADPQGLLLQQADADARRFGRIVRRNWFGALLVNRSAERAEPGRRSDLAQNAPGQKLSCRQFAKLAGCDRRTTARYLDTWDRAAADGLLPPAASLKPGDEVDLSHLDAETWERYYHAPERERECRSQRRECARALRGVRNEAFLPGTDFNSTYYRGALQLDCYQKLMGRPSPTGYPEDSIPGRQFSFRSGDDLPPPALYYASPYPTDKWARAIMTVLCGIDKCELSCPEEFLSVVREQFERIARGDPPDSWWVP